MDSEQQLVKQLNQIITNIQDKNKNIKPVMELIAAMISRFIELNFEAHGRWDGHGTDIFSGGSYKWPDLSQSTKQNYEKFGYLLEPTLLRQKNLYSQIEVFVIGRSTIGISANSDHSAIHQFGGTIHHPGGTPYIITGDESGGILARFVTKDYAAQHPEKIAGVTGPHDIVIPARPFITITPEDLQELIDTLVSFYIK